MSTEMAKDSLHSYGKQAAARAAEDTVRTRRLHAEVQAVPVPWAGMGTLMVLALGVWLLVGEFALYLPYTVTGQNTALRDQGFAIAVLVVGMFLRTHPRNKVAVVVIALLGLLLVASGLWESHQDSRAMINEIVTGALLVCAAVAVTVGGGDVPRSHA